MTAYLVSRGGLVLALLGASLPAHAAPAGITVTQITGGVPVISTHSQSVTDSNAYGDVSAKVDFGAIKVKSTVTADPGPQSFNNASIGISASTADYLTIDAPPGVTTGWFTGHLVVDWKLTSDASTGGSGGNAAFSNAKVKVELPEHTVTVFDLGISQSTYGGGSFPNFSSSSLTLDGMPLILPLPPLGQKQSKTFDFNIYFTNLDPILLGLTVSCDSTVITLKGGQSGTTTCGLDHSIYWGGISGGFDQNGVAIPGFAVTSDSGFDYNKASPALSPAPEPASWAMLIAGFGLTGAAMRRRRRAVA